MPRWILAVSAALMLTGAPAATAQTVGFADAIKILAASCGNDIESYCKTATLANNGIGQCLVQNQDKVSAKCTEDFAVVTTLIQERLAAQAAAPEICANDARQYCGDRKPGAGHVLRCLLKSERVVSKKCNTAIDLAGYR